MGAPSVSRHDLHHNASSDAAQPYHHWAVTRRTASIVAILTLLLVTTCVLLVANDYQRFSQIPPVSPTLLNRSDPSALPETSLAANGTTTTPPSQPNSWLLFDESGSRTVKRSASVSGTSGGGENGAGTPSKVGFKWATGAILDDFALGMGLESVVDDDYERSSTSDSNSSGVANKVHQQNDYEDDDHLLLRQLQWQQQPRPLHQTQVIDNMSYSKTQKDLRAAREMLERQLLSTPVVGTNNNQKSTPPAEGAPAAPANISTASVSPALLCLKNSASSCPSSSSEQFGDSGSSIMNQTFSSSSSVTSPPTPAKETIKPRRNSSTTSGSKIATTTTTITRRHKRRAGAMANERGKPILNEFSFPANLVQGMRFVLMCQVLDGEPPIQIKWFKDNLDLAALLMQHQQQQQQQANEDNHRHQSDQYGPAASQLISSSGSSGDALNSSAIGGQQQQHQQHGLDYIEMISNDELGSSLLFRKVRQQHSGNYTCLASNRFGATSYTSLMTVKVPPTWRVEPQNRESIMGEQITIDCQAVGNPNPFLRWKFASVQHDKIVPAADYSPNSAAPQISSSVLPVDFQSTTTNQLMQQQQQQQYLQSFKLINSNHHVQTLENGSLIIRQAGKEHEGLYLCEADNGVEPSLVKQIKLIVHKQAHFLDDIQVLVQPAAAVGSTTTMTTTGAAVSAPVPPPGQQQDQQQSLGGSKSLGQKDTMLPISIQQQQQQHHHHHQQPNQLTPSIKVVSLPQNSSLVRLVCSPYGDVPIQLDWLKDGHLIHTHSSGGPPGSSVGSNNNNGLPEGATGQSSGGGLLSSSSPSSSSLLLSMSEQSSTIGRFHVSSRWNPLRSPGGSISSSSSSSTVQNGLESELILANLARHDAGLYTCSARNAFGQSERKLRLIVQEPPESPTMVDVARISSRSIALRWLAPFDGNSPITKYVIEYRKQPSSPAPGSSASNQLHALGDNAPPVGRSEKKMPVMVGLKTGSRSGGADSDLEPVFISDAMLASGQQAAGSMMVGGAGQLGLVAGDRAQIQHTIHDLEPLTTYSMRVIAVNAIGQSRPSVALSLRTEEEVPSTVPDLVEAIVLSSRSIKLRWTISYSLEHELIDGFFIGYRSFDSSALLLETTNTNGADPLRATQAISTAGTGAGAGAGAGSGGMASQVGTTKQLIERPTFTYKTIRLINQHQQAASDDSSGSTSPLASMSSSQQQDQSSAQQQQEAANSGATPVLSPISSVTKTVPATGSAALSNLNSNNNKFSTQLANGGDKQTMSAQGGINGGEVSLVVISNFEYVISGLERNTEYTILIQCFNKKGTGPSSDPVVTKTLMHDPPEKLTLVASELTETSLRLSWHFPAEMKVGSLRSTSQNGANEYTQQQQSSPGRGLSGSSPGSGSQELVDGFVLTFAKIAQPASQSSKTKHHHHQQQQQQQQRQQADQAARISKQFPAPSDHHNFQYNPPIQPSQLLDHQWQAIQLAPQQREHTLKNLECGTWYAMKMWAFNKVGKGEPSDLVTASTRGKAPVPPTRNAFLAVNSTQVKLNLSVWYDGGCEIEKFVVQYRARGQREWILVSSSILREQGAVIIRDLAPAASYELLVGAQNHVGFSEAKYRFTTLDSEGRQVVTTSKSFLPILNDDDNDVDSADSSMVDYSSDDQLSGPDGGNIRRESFAGGDHLSPGAHGGRWLLFARHILNSPLTLLLTFCIFLVLLGLLLFHRFGNPSIRNGQHSQQHHHHQHNYHHANGSSSTSTTTTGGLPGAGSKMTQHEFSSSNGANGGGGAPIIIRRCSLDGMTAILDGDPALSCATTNGGGSSSASTDSPARMLNVHSQAAASTMGRLGNPSSHHVMGATNYGSPLECHYNNPDNGLMATYCNPSHQANGSGGVYGASSAPQGFHHSEAPNNSQQQQQLQSASNNWASATLDHHLTGNHQLESHQSQQQHLGFYTALPPTSSAYAPCTVQRSTTMDSSSASQHEPDQLGQDARQQYLMQMLLISPQQQQQQHNLSAGQADGQRHEAYSASMATAAALATLARQKTGLLKQSLNTGTADFIGPNGPTGGGHLYQSGPGNFTLGRMPPAHTNQQETFHVPDNKCRPEGGELESYQLESMGLTFRKKDREEKQASLLLNLNGLGRHSQTSIIQQQQQPDPQRTRALYDHDTSAMTYLSSSFTIATTRTNTSASSTSGCYTTATLASTSQSGLQQDSQEGQFDCETSARTLVGDCGSARGRKLEDRGKQRLDLDRDDDGVCYKTRGGNSGTCVDGWNDSGISGGNDTSTGVPSSSFQGNKKCDKSSSSQYEVPFKYK